MKVGTVRRDRLTGSPHTVNSLGSSACFRGTCCADTRRTSDRAGSSSRCSRTAGRTLAACALEVVIDDIVPHQIVRAQIRERVRELDAAHEPRLRAVLAADDCSRICTWASSTNTSRTPVSEKSSIVVSSVIDAAGSSPRAAATASAVDSSVPPMQKPSVLTCSRAGDLLDDTDRLGGRLARRSRPRSCARSTGRRCATTG